MPYNKEQLLALLRAAVTDGTITESDVLAFANQSKSLPVQDFAGVITEERAISLGTPLTIERMLYYVGGFIALIGAGVFIAQFWSDLGSLGRVMTTLGGGIIAYSLGMYLMTEKRFVEMSAAFHLIGGVLFPSGMVVTIYELFPDTEPSAWFWTFVFGVTTAVYAASYSARSHFILMTFLILNATALAYAVLFGVLSPLSDVNAELAYDLYLYLTILIGISYLYLGKIFSTTTNSSLSRLLYFGGAPAVFGSTFAFMVKDTGFWTLLFLGVLAGGFYLTILLRSNIILLWTTLSLMAYVSYLTGKYFADVVSWPIAIIFIGFMLIGMGYYSVTLSRRIKSGNISLFS